MKDIYEYIKLSKDERQKHLDLGEPCIERGGFSSYFKGLLADNLDTTIPQGHKVYLCHACNNGACCNPKHIYWGTARENALDRIRFYNEKNVWERTIAKYGSEEAHQIQCRKNPAKSGRGNKGKSRSEQHCQNLSISGKRAWKERKDRTNQDNPI